ncbi:MAG: type IV pilin protein [Pseudoxanthomonas sp.]
MSPVQVAGTGRTGAGAIRCRAEGFTLIELMIVVMVIAVLAAIAYPSYSQHVRKAWRAQAEADLVEYAQLAERFHTVNNTYAGLALPAEKSPREAASVSQYTLALNTTQSTFTLTATPASANQRKDKCGTLSLNQVGVKTSSGASMSECW